MNRHYLKTNEDLRLAVARAAERKVVAVDIETKPKKGWESHKKAGLDAHLSEIRLVQFATRDDTWIADLNHITNVEPLKRLVTDPDILKLGQNLQFECAFFLVHWGVRIKRLFDTMIAARLFQRVVKPSKDGILPREWDPSEIKMNLGAIARRYCKIDLPKDEQKSDWSRPELTESQIEYAYRDVEVLFPIYDELRARLKASKMVRVAKMEFDAVLACAKMVVTGWDFDAEHVRLLQADVEQRIDEYKNWLGKRFPAPQEGLLGPALRNLKSKDEVRRGFLQRYGVQLEKTHAGELLKWREPVDALVCAEILRRHGRLGLELPTEEKIEELADEIRFWREKHGDIAEVVDHLVDYSSLNTLKGLCNKLASSVHPITGRLHPSIRQIGQEQHRTATSDPNTSQVPRPDSLGQAAKWPAYKFDRNLREAIRAPEGRKIVKCDFAGNQLRIIADQANEPRMIKAFRDGIDLHCFTAAMLYHVPIEEIGKKDPRRQKTKNYGFGFGFGVGINRFMNERLKDDRKQPVEDDCRRDMNAYFNLFRRLKPWHDRTREQVELEHRIITPVLGRIIEFVPGGNYWNEPINFIISATEVDGARLALGRLDAELEAGGYDADIFGFVYDEINVNARVDQAEEVGAILERVMRDSMQEMVEQVPIEVELTIGNTWAG